MAYRESPDGETIVVVGVGKAVIGLDRETGQRLWHQDADVPLGGAVHAVRVVGELAVALAGHSVMALDYRTGEVRWKVRLAHPAVTLLVHGDRWFVGSQGEVSALSDAGQLLWHDDFPGMGLQGPAIAIGARGVAQLGDAS
jgi:outer membrane protein assembly factor BamB